MKLIATLVILIAACTIQNTFASKKVTASITVTGLTAAEINDKSTEILAAVATLLEVDASKVVSEGDASVSTVTTSAPTSAPTTTTTASPVTSAATTTTTAPTTTTTASPVSPSPVSPAPGRRMYDIDTVEWDTVDIPERGERRRLNAVIFSFSVIVANEVDATAIKTKLESTAFESDLVTKLGTIYTGKTISIDVSTPTVDNYTPPAAKKAAVDAGFPLAMPSKVVHVCIGMFSIAMVW